MRFGAKRRARNGSYGPETRPTSAGAAPRSREAGQATVELLAGIPALLLAALIAFQLLAAGYALTLADGAAEAGALAGVAGEDAEEAARGALPGWAEDRIEVSEREGAVEVELTPPSPVPGLGDLLAVTSRAWVRPPEDEP